MTSARAATFGIALFLGALLAVAPAVAAVRYVDPSNPDATDAGGGTASQPYRSLAYAMKELRPGDVLNLAPGVYREGIRFPAEDWSSAAQTVIQSAPGGEALIKGSDVVTGWQQRGAGLYVKTPWTINSEQVFVDGKPLRQIGGTVFGGYPDKPNHPLAGVLKSAGGIWPGRTPGGLGQMTNGSFYYDEQAQSLYVKVALPSLSGHVVEASVRPFLVFGQNLRNVTLRNLRFRHANTTAVAQSGALTLSGSHLRLEHLDIREVDGAGLDLTGDDIVVSHSRADYCGQVGMKVRGRGDRLIDNETSFNNTRGFNKWWEAGGAKFVGNGGLQGSEVVGHVAIGNNGDGLWFDWMNDDNRIHDNVLAYNAGFGIQYEASQRAYIYDNYVFDNKQRGIYLPDASRSVVAHNLVANNGMEGIAIIDEGRPSKKAVLVPRDNAVFGNIVAWSGKAAIVLPEGLLGNVSDYNLIVSARDQPMFSVGWGSRASPQRRGLAAWRAASRQDGHSWAELLPVPQSLYFAFRAKRIGPPWDALEALARNRLVRPIAAAQETLPHALRVASLPGPAAKPPSLPTAVSTSQEPQP